jgi:Tfp pilus assembly protein PilX
MTEIRSIAHPEEKTRGYVLLVVVVFSFILFALATTYVGKTMFDRKTSMNEIHRIQATELARAGVSLGLERLSAGGSMAEEGLKHDLPTGAVWVTAEDVVPGKTWRLSCTGSVPEATHPVATASIAALVGFLPGDATSARPVLLSYLEGERISKAEEE